MAVLRKRGAELGVTGDELERGRDRTGSLYSGQGSVENWQDEFLGRQDRIIQAPPTITPNSLGGRPVRSRSMAVIHRSDGAGLSWRAAYYCGFSKHLTACETVSF